MSCVGRLAGRKALVTGSGTGIGREIALEFARQGADVVLHYAHSDSGANSAVDEIREMGRNAAAFRADFDNVDDVVALAESAVAFLSRVDCLVNNAGITFNKPFLHVTREQFDRMYHVNIRAQFFQGFDQNRCLNRHVQTAGNARSFQGLLFAVFGTKRHQSRHFGFC